jgi:hypothetical protein
MMAYCRAPLRQVQKEDRVFRGLAAGLLLVLVAAGCRPTGGIEPATASEEQAPVDCSIVRLLATPEKYHDRLVGTYGYALVEFENWALYLSESDARNGITANAIWLHSFADSFKEAPKSHSGKYVFIEGVFNAEHPGHAGLFSGSLEQIRRIAVLMAKPEPTQ